MILCLAPMDGITDCVFRLLTKEIFQRTNFSDKLILFTEFMSSQGYIRNPQWTIKHLLKTDLQNPIFAQIFGNDKESLLKTALNIEYLNEFDGVDLNMWCPSFKIVGNWWGAGMLKDRKASLEIIKTLSKNLNINFSIKTRLGLNNEDKERQFDFLCEVSDYCDIITVHGRTLSQLHSWETDKEYVIKLREKIKHKTSVFFNWGINSYQEASNLKWFFDWVMIGRWAIGNPWIFSWYSPNLEEIKSTVLRHLDLSIALEIYCNEKMNIENFKMPSIKELENIVERKKELEKKTLKTPVEFRKHLFSYIKWLKGSKEFKRRITTIWNYKNLRDEILKFFD